MSKEISSINVNDGTGISIIYNEINTVISKIIKKYKISLFFIYI